MSDPAHQEDCSLTRRLLTSSIGSLNSLGLSLLSVSAHPKAPSFILSTVMIKFMSCKPGAQGEKCGEGADSTTLPPAIAFLARSPPLPSHLCVLPQEAEVIARAVNNFKVVCHFSPADAVRPLTVPSGRQRREERREGGG